MTASSRSRRAEPGHRGAFGEHGGDAGGALIERGFRERIAIVGVRAAADDTETVERSLDELARLIDTAGADVVDRLVQRRNTPEAATYIGRGKVGELASVCEELDVDTVVFDNDLTPAQQTNLTATLGRSVLDRTAVILDIFAQNAHSRQGKAQVELAQLQYLLPRLAGRGTALSQQGGGIGTRGPGETQLEVDRRRIQRRIHRLQADLRDITRHRGTQRKARRGAGIPLVAIVGYTNAGKSTLLNQLTDAGVLTEDRLFATLDATTRKLSIKGGQSVLLTDTVGFIAKLPHQLVEAFASTLDVANDADLLLHLVDATTPDPDIHLRAAQQVIEEIGAADRPQLLVWNKIDSDRRVARRLIDRHPGSVGVSSRTGEGVDALCAAIGDRLRSLSTCVELDVPFGRGDVLAALHREGQVLTEEAGPDAMHVRVRLSDESLARFDEFAVTGVAG